MRSKVNRRINREPIRSPSPDIANRSIIKQTSSPLYEVLAKSRAMSQSNAINGHNIDEMRRSLADWQSKYRQIEQQLNRLLLQNSELKRQNHQLGEQLTRKSRQLLKQPDTAHSQAELRQYQSRFDLLMQQIHRMQGLLQQQKANNDLLTHQIEYLRQDPMKKVRNTKNIYPLENTHNKLNEIQHYLLTQMDRKKKDVQQKSRIMMNGLEDRLNKVQDNQLEMESLMRKRQFMTPKIVKEGKGQESTTPGYRSTSPGEVKKFGRRSIVPDEEKRQLEEQLRQKQEQVDKLLLDNKTLTIQLQHEKQRSALRKTSECPKCKIYLKQIEQLQEQLQRLKKTMHESKSAQEQAFKSEIEGQNKSFSSNIEEYLQRIKGIKNILNNEEFRQFVNRINELISENGKLHSKVQKLLVELENAYKEGKAKEVEQMVLLNQMSRENEVLKTQIRQQNGQISKLEELIKQKYHYKRQELQEDQPELIQGQEGKIFQRYIEQAIRKLENLQQSMQNNLRE